MKRIRFGSSGHAPSGIGPCPWGSVDTGHTGALCVQSLTSGRLQVGRPAQATVPAGRWPGRLPRLGQAVWSRLPSSLTSSVHPSMGHLTPHVQLGAGLTLREQGAHASRPQTTRWRGLANTGPCSLGHEMPVVAWSHSSKVLGLANMGDDILLGPLRAVQSQCVGVPLPHSGPCPCVPFWVDNWCGV